jgi:hypothetical protein
MFQGRKSGCLSFLLCVFTSLLLLFILLIMMTSTPPEAERGVVNTERRRVQARWEIIMILAR